MLSACSYCRAGHNFPGPGKRRMQARVFRYLPNPLAAEPRAQSQLQGLYQSKQNPSIQASSQLENTAGGKDCLHHSLAQQVSGEHFPAWKKRNENTLSQWPIPDLEHTWEVKQLWTPAHPRTGSRGSTQHLAPPWTCQERHIFLSE